MAHPIYDLAAAERARALAEFKKLSPFAYAAFLRAEQTMKAYEDVPPVAAALAVGGNDAGAITATGLASLFVPQKQSEASRVVAAAEVYLREQKARRTSREITYALQRRGVEIGGGGIIAQVARVSAHLSASAKFNNDRTEGGYGLSEWPRSHHEAASL
jgi:hypothetical protein